MDERVHTARLQFPFEWLEGLVIGDERLKDISEVSNC